MNVHTEEAWRKKYFFANLFNLANILKYFLLLFLLPRKCNGTRIEIGNGQSCAGPKCDKTCSERVSSLDQKTLTICCLWSHWILCWSPMKQGRLLDFLLVPDPTYLYSWPLFTSLDAAKQVNPFVILMLAKLLTLNQSNRRSAVE